MMSLKERSIMEVREVAIKDINPAPYNPRKIEPEEFQGLCESLKKFGFVDPLIVNKRTNILVGGHQRLKAADHLGYSEVPVTYVDLDETEEKALNVALNSHMISGKYDLEVLPTLLDEIKLELPELNKELRFPELAKDLKIHFIEMEEEEDKKINLSDDEKYLIVVECKDELDQKDLYEEFQTREISCKLMS